MLGLEERYKKLFGRTVTTFGLTGEAYSKAQEALRGALKSNTPFQNDAEFYKKIGVKQPAPGELR